MRGRWLFVGLLVVLLAFSVVGGKKNVRSPFLRNVVEDKSPELGGVLGGQGYDLDDVGVITASGLNVYFDTGLDGVVGIEWHEKVNDYGFVFHVPMLRPKGFVELNGEFYRPFNEQLYVDGNLFVGNFGSSGQPGRIYVVDWENRYGLMYMGYNNLTLATNQGGNILFRPQDTIFIEPQLGANMADFVDVRVDGNVLADNVSASESFCLRGVCITEWPSCEGD